MSELLENDTFFVCLKIGTPAIVTYQVMLTKSGTGFLVGYQSVLGLKKGPGGAGRARFQVHFSTHL